MRIAAVLILLFTLTAGTASAGACVMYVDDFQRERTRYEGSLTDQGILAQGWLFYGYIQGSVDGLDQSGAVCVPVGIVVEDVIAVLRRRFDDLADKRDVIPSKYCAISLIKPILMDRFPCDPRPEAKAPAK